MPRSVSAVFDWTMIAAAVGLLLVILFSPSGSFVRAPTDAGRTVVPAADVEAGAALGD